MIIVGFAEYYYLKDYFEMLGFPHLNDSSYGDCGILGLNPGCTEERTSSLILSFSFV